MSLLKDGKKQKLRNSVKLPKLTIQQQIDNNEVIERMNRKITFVKNQRHLGSAITYHQALNNEVKQNTFTSSLSRATVGNNNVTLSSSAKFKSIPQLIVFNHFQPHRTYESEIKLVNLSQNIQRIKITPLSKKEFNIYSVQYPRQESGDIAPGMSIRVTVRFRPSNLNDLQEELIFIFNGGIIKVPIIAKRQRPSIQWPNCIDCGHCWIGNKNYQQISVSNKGGQAQYHIVQNTSNAQSFRKGFFNISSTVLKFSPLGKQSISVIFQPQSKGNFKQIITFKSNQGQQQAVSITLKGGAYNAQLVLEKINGEEIKQQALQNNVYINGTEINTMAKADLSIRNLAVVDVDYFWHFQSSLAYQKNSQGQKFIQISNPKGKFAASSQVKFDISFLPKNRNPQNIKAQLYLYNLPQKSLMSKSLVKTINGTEAIQCFVLNIKTRPKQSATQVYPLHKQIVKPIFKNVPIQDYFTISNTSDSKRNYKVSKITTTESCNSVLISQDTGIIQPKQQKRIYFSFQITKLLRQEQRAYFLIEFDNSSGKVFSVGAYVQYPQIKYSQAQIFYGLCRTYTKIKKTLILSNEQPSSVSFKILNPVKFYQLEFYDFYEFNQEDSQRYKKRRLTIRNQLTSQIIDQNQEYSIQSVSSFVLELQYSTMSRESVDEQIQIQVIDGKTSKIPIILQVQQLSMEISRKEINLRQIYKGNVYNSNKFLSNELSIENKSNIQTTFQFQTPNQDSCITKIDPLKFKVPPRGKKRIDLLIEPIKTGDWCQSLQWKYYDDFKVNPKSYTQLFRYIQFNKQQGSSSLFKPQVLTLKAEIKGVQIKYYIKDQTRAKRVRQKIQDIPASVKHSTMSFKSSKTGFHHQQQKTVYPYLQELNFYSCEINQVKQMQIMIENDSGLTAQFNIYAEAFHTLEKVETIRKENRGLVGQEQQAFTSQMGKTFLQARVLDKSQKVHLSNNKGVSIMCEPSQGILHKKQTQKVIITMFNDTSGRFKDNLVIDIKDHQQKKFPMDIHIKGTPVILSRNQLGISFNEEIPVMNLGSMLINNGTIKKNIKVVNKGPKQVSLSWKTYPYNKIDSQKDLIKIQFAQAAPGTNNLIEVRWNAIQPQIDHSSPFLIQPRYFQIKPRQKTLKGRQQFSFNLIVNQLSEFKQYQTLLICQPQLGDGQKKVKMQNLAVVVSTQCVAPILSMDIQHKNQINMLQLFATQHTQKSKQTDSANNLRRIKLKNQLQTNLQFQLQIHSKNCQTQSFKIVSINTNSPINPYDGNKTYVVNKNYVLTYESFIQILVELTANKKDTKDWPMQEKVRKDGQITINFKNGNEQNIDLVGWLYRPWVQLQMPNQILYSAQNKVIDFGTLHVKSSKKAILYLLNGSKSDGKFTVSYIKYQQSKKINLQKSFWTSQDYEDVNIVDAKQCFFLSHDSGTVLNRSIPVHYMPGTLALPSQQDGYTATHKPVKIQILFKPKTNVLYKSKFRINIQDGIYYDVIVRGKGTFQEELQIK